MINLHESITITQMITSGFNALMMEKISLQLPGIVCYTQYLWDYARHHNLTEMAGVIWH